MDLKYTLLIGYLTLVQGGEYHVKEQELALFRAEDECYKQMQENPVVLTGVFCPRQFDNILCWPDSPAGITHKQHCPSYINKFDQTEFAYKTCLENGTWYLNPETNDTWTNFSKCIIATETVPQLIQNHMPSIKLLYIVGYSLSLTTLLLAVFIMLYFRRLRCPRNLIHVNLFLVYILRAFISLLKEILLVQDIGFQNDVKISADGKYEFIIGSHWGCKTFYTVLHYMVLTSIIWIFVEGLYLQLILSYSVSIKKIKVRWFVLLGWGSPVLFAVSWGIAHYFLDDSYCWNVSHFNKGLFWIIRGPIVISVIVTFLIFVNILRILFTKLTAQNCPSSRRYRYRRLAKSTLILIPLFAVYYMGFIWLPDDMDPMPQLIEMYTEMMFNSFQGFLVSLLFCFLNAEVQNEIKKKWRRHFLKREGSVSRGRKPKKYNFSETDSNIINQQPKKQNRTEKHELCQINEETALNGREKSHEGDFQDHNDNIHIQHPAGYNSQLDQVDKINSQTDFQAMAPLVAVREQNMNEVDDLNSQAVNTKSVVKFNSQTGNNIDEFNSQTGNNIDEFNSQTGNNIVKLNSQTGNNIDEFNSQTGNNIVEFNSEDDINTVDQLIDEKEGLITMAKRI